MPQMIPNQIADNTQRGEKTIFEALRKDPNTRDWVVFHSSKVKNPTNPSRQHRREIDFVIIIPKYCSVICLEVKDRRYKIEDRQWYFYEDKYNKNPLCKSPPIQTIGAMNAFRIEFASFFSSKLLSLGCSLALTSQPKPKKELNEKGLMLFQNDISDLGTKLNDFAKELSTINKANLPGDSFMSAQKELKNLQTKLKDDMTPNLIERSDLETLRQQLLDLTTDQLISLRIVNNNPRCVIDGAAGTGKTVLAMELAKKRCEAGKTVALLCSNPNLSRRFDIWADTLPKDKGGQVVAGTPTTLLSWALERENDTTLVDKHRQRLDDSPTLEKLLKFGYLDEKWQSFMDETIKDLRTGGIFDYLIVDEAQNLCDEVFLKLMAVLLKGGLKEGNWAMFGDFTNQNIVSSRSIGDVREFLKNFGLNWSNDKLETNCRNTYQIADEIAQLLGIESFPISGVHGPDVEIKYFDSEKNLDDLLNNLLTDLKKRNFIPPQIILLSSDVEGFDTNHKYGGWELHNIREVKQEKIDNKNPLTSYSAPLIYSDIYDFQGLESDIVILIIPVTKDQVILTEDVTLPREEHLIRVLYTGMSRAKAMLVVVAHKSYKGNLERSRELYNKKKQLTE